MNPEQGRQLDGGPWFTEPSTVAFTANNLVQRLSEGVFDLFSAEGVDPFNEWGRDHATRVTVSTETFRGSFDVGDLPECRYLGVFGSGRLSLRVGQCPQLRRFEPGACPFEWTDPSRLEWLDTSTSEVLDEQSLGKFVGLKHLIARQAKAPEIVVPPSLHLLEDLSLHQTSTLARIHFRGEHQDFRGLYVEGAPNFYLGTLPASTEVISLSDCGGLHSTDVLRELKNLKDLRLLGRSIVADGEVGYLQELAQRMKRLLVRHKKHYSARVPKVDYDPQSTPQPRAVQLSRETLIAMAAEIPTLKEWVRIALPGDWGEGVLEFLGRRS